ncbi:hypothetical protein ACVXG7_32005 [Enterobacter hormaechei]
MTGMMRLCRMAGGHANAIHDAIRPPAQSPFDTMSEAEFTAM